VKETNLIYGVCKKCAMEERFGLKKDIRGPVLPFVHLLLFYHSIHSLFTWLSATRQSHSRSHSSFFFLEYHSPLLLFVPTKVPWHQAIGNSVRCA